MNKTMNICNNCGKQGHLFHQCKLPITSYGVIVFRSSNKGLQFLMLRRKDSFGYIDIIRGKYSMSNMIQLQTIVDEMSIAEKERLTTTSFSSLWKQMWGDTQIGSRYKNEEFASQKKFETLKNGIQIISDIKNTSDIKTISLETLIDNSTTAWNETEWEFPKGRRNYQEKDIDCALREFEEETGLSKNYLTIINSYESKNELFEFKFYKHTILIIKYFLIC
jgi:hypothetical protein